MMEDGHDVPYMDVRTKIENLTKKYNAAKQGASSSSNLFLRSFPIHNMQQSTVDNENTVEYFVEALDTEHDGCKASNCSESCNE